MTIWDFMDKHTDGIAFAAVMIPIAWMFAYKLMFGD